jgi:hypothetical protein
VDSAKKEQGFSRIGKKIKIPLGFSPICAKAIRILFFSPVWLKPFGLSKSNH